MKSITESIKELNHFAIFVADLDKSLKFYIDTLGFELKARPDFKNLPGAWIKIGDGHELHLIGGRKHSNINHGKRATHFAIEVENIYEVEEFLKIKNLEYLGVFNRPDGGLQIFIKDPDGYFIEFSDLTNVK